MLTDKVAKLIERFDAKYHVDPATGCWLWTAAKNQGGYGQFAFGRAPMLAHRVSWLLSKGFIPERTHVLHKCDNPPCVNPEHLFLGTDRDNVRDMMKKGRANYGARTMAEQHGMAKLTDVQAVEIYRDTRTQAAIAKEYGICPATVSHIKTGRQWSTVTGATRRA